MKTDLNHKDTKGTKIWTVDEGEEIADPWSRLVIGAAIAVHRTLGPGFLESVYEEALCIELQEREIPFAQQAPVAVRYRSRVVGEGLIDVLVGGTLVVELKAVEPSRPFTSHKCSRISGRSSSRSGYSSTSKLPISARTDSSGSSTHDPRSLCVLCVFVVQNVL
jgi:GxxExxY protein